MASCGWICDRGGVVGVVVAICGAHYCGGCECE